MRALTLASRAFLDQAPEGFADVPMLSPRGAIFIATPEQAQLRDEHCALRGSMSSQSRRLSIPSPQADPAFTKELQVNVKFRVNPYFIIQGDPTGS